MRPATATVVAAPRVAGGLIVEVYVKDFCVQCRATRLRLKQLGVAFVELDAAAHVELLIAYGITTAPGVIVRQVGTGRVLAAWGGFRPDRITEYITTVQEGTSE